MLYKKTTSETYDYSLEKPIYYGAVIFSDIFFNIAFKSFSKIYNHFPVFIT